MSVAALISLMPTRSAGHDLPAPERGRQGEERLAFEEAMKPWQSREEKGEPSTAPTSDRRSANGGNAAREAGPAPHERADVSSTARWQEVDDVDRQPDAERFESVDDEMQAVIETIEQWARDAAMEPALVAGDGVAVDEQGWLATAVGETARSAAGPVDAAVHGNDAAQVMRQAAEAGLAQHGRDLAEMTALAALADVAPEANPKANPKAGQSLGAMLWPDATMQMAGQVRQAGGEGKPAWEAMLAQLVAAASASTSAGGEAVPPPTPTGQGGGLPGNPSSLGALNQPAMSEADVQTNAARLARAMNSALNQGGGTLTFRMTPPELGTVRIQLQMQAGSVNATLHAETDTARSMLSQQLSQLRQSLEGQGLTVDRLSVQAMNGNSSSQTQNDTQGSPGDGRSRGEYAESGRQQSGQRDDGSQSERDEAFEQALQTLNEMG